MSTRVDENLRIQLYYLVSNKYTYLSVYRMYCSESRNTIYNNSSLDCTCVLLSVIADISGSRVEYWGAVRRNKRRSAGMRVLCVPWKRDIPLDLALGRTIDIRVRGVAILEHVRKMHTHEFTRAIGSGMCDLVCNERQIDFPRLGESRSYRRNCVPRESGNFAEVWENERTPLVSRIARDSISRYDGR